MMKHVINPLLTFLILFGLFCSFDYGPHLSVDPCTRRELKNLFNI